MNSSAATANVNLQLRTLLQQFDVGQAAEQVARLSTDLACAFESVRFVLRELRKVRMHDRLNSAYACGCHLAHQTLVFAEPYTWQGVAATGLAISPVTTSEPVLGASIAAPPS